MKGIVWFRNDLRVHDNESLLQATQDNSEVVCVYCIDPRWFAETPFGFSKTGPYRAQFLLESLHDLRQNLQSLGGDLLVTLGEPETVVIELIALHGINNLYYQLEAGTEEASTEQAIVDYCNAKNIAVHTSHGATLYHMHDIPFALDELPHIYTNYRKATEQKSRVRPLLPTPIAIYTVTNVASNPIPTLAQLGLATPETDPRAAMVFTGGETAALQRLHHYLWGTEALKTYKETRNGLLGADYSSKFSPWLALGCLSARQIYWEVQAFEQQRIKNDSTYWLVFELIWRDYFRFVALRYGAVLFQKGGIRQQPGAWHTLPKVFNAWRLGNTGVDFVDANMRELLYTGFMSNRGRQNVASYLVKDLKLDWRYGAAWFEHCLIDYDVASNYGNWNYIAGIGNDPRDDRYFNIATQVAKYDPKGQYMHHWLYS